MSPPENSAPPAPDTCSETLDDWQDEFTEPPTRNPLQNNEPIPIEPMSPGARLNYIEHLLLDDDQPAVDAENDWNFMNIFGMRHPFGLREDKRLPPDAWELERLDLEPLRAPPMMKNNNENFSRFDCKICYHGYNGTTRTPRILAKCGHTVCEVCAHQLLKENDFECADCPFCRKVTLLDEEDVELPKNYALMEIMGI
ncbi:hypothetical protein GCK72_011334 [Caenorhabditis remanei]|uniref:RING-type domain-containing protein n=1 Tax=Caenorhabditis remanei TaxID=31234 RepID=A0A6A5H7P7_CAERE|nr:hypothetical protein GCK72_011334 [Caenorhabditis remanei]KAF1763069.1 hypothetical protein GCK72_011334 [Caenorhabditis remanei]